MGFPHKSDYAWHLVLQLPYFGAASTAAYASISCRASTHSSGSCFATKSRHISIAGQSGSTSSRKNMYKVVPQFVSVQLVYKYYFTRVDLGVISIVNGIYKPTYNWGGTTLYQFKGLAIWRVRVRAPFCCAFPDLFCSAMVFSGDMATPRLGCEDNRLVSPQTWTCEGWAVEISKSMEQRKQRCNVGPPGYVCWLKYPI